MKLKILHQLLKLFLTVTIIAGCLEEKKSGYLHISSNSSSQFEIYQIKGDSSLQFTSRQLGNFNTETKLQPGRYLILADCSHKIVTIHPNEKASFKSHVVRFNPSETVEKNDIFSVQCSRFEKIHSRQFMTKKYTFNIIEGKRELLIGMKPLKIDLNYEKPSTVDYTLSSIEVTTPKIEAFLESPFYVSPSNQPLSVTQSQSFGSKLFLLHGIYELSLNGTKKIIDLKKGENKKIAPGFLKVEPSKIAQVEAYKKIKGDPYNYTLNHLFPLYLSQLYPVLPGDHSIELKGSHISKNATIIENESHIHKLRSVTIDLGCSVHEWECLGKKEVKLFQKNKIYPYLESHSDVPILFNETNTAISLEGSMGLKYLLSNKEKDIRLKAGKITFKPIPKTKAGFITDLVRLEALSLPYLGYSNDIGVDQSTTMTLIAGDYKLVKYTSVNDQERFDQSQIVRILPNEHKTIHVSFYVSDSKASAFKKEKIRAKKRNQKRSERIEFLNHSILFN